MPARLANLTSADPTLSVVLPNYNHAKLIGRAVAALRSQKRAPGEIVIIDDGSTDDSARIIAELASSWTIIRVVANKQNQGAIAALSRGLDECSGKYIYFAAADDWIEPNFFASALDLLERHAQAGLFCGEATLVDGCTGRILGTRPVVRPAGRPTFLEPSEVARLLKRSDNWILTGSAVFRRDRVLEAGGFSSDLGSFADGYLARKIALQHGFCFAPEGVATWCIFEGGLSRTTASDPERAIRAIDQALAHIAADGIFPPWYSALLARRFRFAAARLAVIARPINRPVLLRLSLRSRIGRALLDAISRFPLGRAGRLMLLGWLWLRFRPVSLAALSKTIWARYWERKRRERGGSARWPLHQNNPGTASNE